MSRRARDRGPQGEWQFFTFPVFFGAAIAAFASFFLTIFLGFIWFYVALLLLSWATAHFVNRTFIGRRQARQTQREAEEEQERRALAARNSPAANTEPTRSRRRRRVRRGRDTDAG